MFLNKKTNKPVKATVILIVCMFAVLCFTAACTPQSTAPVQGTDNAAVEHTTSADPAAVSQTPHSVITSDGVKLTIDGGLDYYITEGLEHNSGNTVTVNDDTTVTRYYYTSDNGVTYVIVTDNPEHDSAGTANASDIYITVTENPEHD